MNDGVNKYGQDKVHRLYQMCDCILIERRIQVDIVYIEDCVRDDDDDDVYDGENCFLSLTIA